MSLRVAAGTLVHPAAVLDQPVRLDIPRIRQIRDLWCWVTCFCMVLKNLAPAQCAVAQVAFPARQCCTNEPSCNEAVPPARIKGLWEHFGFPNVEPRCGTLTPDQIRTELGAGPIEVWLGNMESCPDFTGGGHVVLVVGCQGTTEVDMVLKVRDPNPKSGPAEITYQGLVKDLSYGPWVGTWTHIHNS